MIYLYTYDEGLAEIKGEEASMTERQRLAEIIRRLKKEYPSPGTALNFSSPFELLAATILSAQTTDAQVNKVTEQLFRKYITIKDFAERPLEELKKDVSSVNFYNNKAKSIQASARMILERFDGKVPQSMDELISLPGVARKTANIVLSSAFGINEGIAVDTHVKRLTERLGLSGQTDPVRIEKDLMSLALQTAWGELSHLFILHGRAVCRARRADHKACVIADICPSRDRP